MIHQQLFICIPQFEEIFHPYSRYCSEQTNCQDYCKEQDRNSEVFKAYLAVSLPFEFILLREQSERNELRLYIPNISIKKTEVEQQSDMLKETAKKVESFVSRVNSHLLQKQENKRLKRSLQE